MTEITEIIVKNNNKHVATQLGPMILEVSKKSSISVATLEGKLSEAMQEYRGAWAKKGAKYEEETIHGYLHEKTWPDMTCSECINIVTRAFDMVIAEGKGNTALIEAYKTEVAAVIKQAYQDDTAIIVANSFAKHAASEIIQTGFQPMERIVAFTLQNNLDACFSLDSADIAFWKVIRTWDEDRQKSYANELATRKTAFTAGDIFSRLQDPIFSQWMALRDKNFRDALRKNNKTSSDMADEIIEDLKKVNDITDEKALSIEQMIVSVTGNGTAKKPIYPKEELDLLLLYKYCLTKNAKMAVLEEVSDF